MENMECSECWADEVGHDDETPWHQCHEPIDGPHDFWRNQIIHRCDCGAQMMETIS